MTTATPDLEKLRALAESTKCECCGGLDGAHQPVERPASGHLAICLGGDAAFLARAYLSHAARVSELEREAAEAREALRESTARKPVFNRLEAVAERLLDTHDRLESAVRDAAQRENARLTQLVTELERHIGNARRPAKWVVDHAHRAHEYDRPYAKEALFHVTNALELARSALSSCSPAPAADGMALVLRVEPNDDAELTCLLCGCATNAPPELCTTFLTSDGSSTAGLHRRCYERAAVPRKPSPPETP